MLHIFHDLSGLKINLQKSEILITSAHEQEVQQLAQIMGCKASNFPIKYLGLPLSNKRLQKQQYMELIQKIENKLTSWKAAMLSIGGRITLVNATLTAMPMYMMQTFLLPKWVIKRIDKIRRRFLWHGHKGQDMRYISLVTWELVTKPKKLGGLGVLNLTTMNRALLSKVMWQWQHVNKPDWMQLIQMETLSAKPWNAANATNFWRSLKHMESFMEVSVQFKMGDGSHIRFWKDAWRGSAIMNQYPLLYSFALNKDISVYEVRRQGTWHIELHQGITEQAAEQHITLLNELHQYSHEAAHQDTPIWLWTNSGVFSVKSYYRAMEATPIQTTHIPRVWELKGPLRVMIFGWLMLRNRILTIDNLVIRGFSMVNRCCMCRMEAETVKHLFGRCKLTTELRGDLVQRIPQLGQCQFFVTGNYKKTMLESRTKQTRQMQLVFSFVIWRERCRRTFQEVDKSNLMLQAEIVNEFRSWFTPNINMEGLTSQAKCSYQKNCCFLSPVLFFQFYFILIFPSFTFIFYLVTLTPLVSFFNGI